MLPEVCPSAGRLGETQGVPGLPDGIPITGVAGDQQAALFGQDCTEPGDAKCTYGTGAFLLMNVGPRADAVDARAADHRRLDAGLPARRARRRTRWRAARSSRARWCSGCATGWASSPSAPEIEALARSVPDSGGVTIVPALTGLGAPHWRPDARGLITGLTRGTTKAHIARAALEAIALQNVDLLAAMQADAGSTINHLRVDGGAAANDLLMQIQADLLGVQIFRPEMVESTALGAAKLAALGIGLPPAEKGSETARMRMFTPIDAPETRARDAGPLGGSRRAGVTPSAVRPITPASWMAAFHQKL